MTNTIKANFVAYRAGVFIPQNDDWTVPTIFETAVAKAFILDQIEPDVESELFKVGVVNVESYACDSEAIAVYRIGSLWYVEHHTIYDCDARIIIEGLGDYLTFQAQWLAPVAAKIMKKGSWSEEQEHRAFTAARKEIIH